MYVTPGFTLIFSISSIKLMTDFEEGEFTDIQKLKEGGNGTVFTAKHKDHGTVAVKVFNDNVNLEEIQIMRKFSDHDNIISFIGTITFNSCFTPRFAIVMEFMTRGSVDDAIYNNKVQYSLETAYSWCLQGARAIAYLHDNKFIHRDIKPANMLLSDSLEVLICDFGLSKDIESATNNFRGATRLYMPPEMFKNTKNNGMTSDVFSFAISIWEIVTKRVPYSDNPEIPGWEWSAEVIKGLRPSLMHISDSDISQLLIKCWCAEPEKRPSMKSIIKVLEDKGNRVSPNSKDTEIRISHNKSSEVSILYSKPEMPDTVVIGDCEKHETVHTY